jgi:hypothetical protein
VFLLGESTLDAPMVQPNRGDDYRRKAEEADQKAKECRDPEAREIHEERARQWRGMADRAERFEW